MEAEVGAGVDNGSSDDSIWDSDGSEDGFGGGTEGTGAVSEGMASKIWAEEDGMKELEDTRTTLRLGIVFCYRLALQSPPRDEWGGKTGTVSHICDVFRLKSKKEE